MDIIESMISENKSSYMSIDIEGNITEVYARPKSVENSLKNKLSDIDIIRGGAIVGQSCKLNQIKTNLCTRCMGTQCVNKCKGLRALPTGNVDTKIMFINKQPTDYETIMSTSCSDRSGMFISLIFDKIGIKRDSIYFTDIIKCNTQLNEASFSECINTYLLQELDLINPKLIIFNGLSALKTCIARNMFTGLSTDVSYGNIYTVKLLNGNEAKVTAIYDLDTVLKKDGNDYSRCKNDLWMQINNTFKSI